jgi:hypothetical protein
MRIGAGLCGLLWASLASAQVEAGATGDAAPASAAAAAPAPPVSTASAAQMKMVQALDPKEYGAAFNVGAQAELIVPTTGVSALLVGYDAVLLQVELSAGFGIGSDTAQNPDGSDLYLTALRLAFPVHRGIRADFSLVVGGGATFIDPSAQDARTIGTAGVGAKFRSFFSPSVALAATFGAVTTFGDGDTTVLFGARPLGSAAVVYFFR